MPFTAGIAAPGVTGKSDGLALVGDAPGSAGVYLLEEHATDGSFVIVYFVVGRGSRGASPGSSTTARRPAKRLARPECT